ncbi:hypothetical protein [Streptomyces sp. UG1]|uniref:hypothetical protein n=1 Tax=Streptomyces sp. UG1 TaxID=3417652 RepID=UPI003CE9ED8F
MTLWLSGMIMTADRLNDYSLDAETTSGLVPATDFTVNNFWANRRAGTVELNIYLQYTGAGISIISGGNIGDTQCCTVPAGWRPNSASTINGHWDDGTASGGFVIGTDGICTLRTSNGSAIATGRNLRLHIVFNQEP